MDPLFFRNQEAMREWFEENHSTGNELIVGYYKVGTKRESVTWGQSVDVALCFGWIDGIRRSIDETSYCIRFTPRRPGSNWSAVNVKKIEMLTRLGLMRDAGLAAFSKRKDGKTGVYAYESPHKVEPDMEFEDKFRQHGTAWNYYQSQSLSYRKITARWVMSAKQEITREKRLDELVKACEAGEMIKAMQYGRK